MSAPSFMSQENYKRKIMQIFYLQNVLLKISGSITLEKPVLNSLTAEQVRPKFSGGKRLRKNFAFGEISL